MTIRFENGIVATLGKKNRILWNATVVSDGEKVAAIGPAAEMAERFPDAESVDCSGKIILPGFICTHHHFYSTMARGMAPPGEPASNFVEILERLWWKLDAALSEEDITLSAQIPLIDCIRNGTTTIIDHHASPGHRDGSLDQIESAVRQAGLRASLCYEVSDRNKPGAGIAENERFIKKVGHGDGQIAAMMGLHASFTVSDETLEKCVGIAKDAGVGCHIHVAEDAADRKDSLDKYGVPTVNRLHSAGVTGEKSIFVHCAPPKSVNTSRTSPPSTTIRIVFFMLTPMLTPMLTSPSLPCSGALRRCPGRRAVPGARLRSHVAEDHAGYGQ